MEVPMSVAYESLSLIEAADLIEETLAPLKSGVKVLHVVSETRAIAAGAPGECRGMSRDRAFRALYDAHAAFVWRNLRRLGVADADVEDKVQEVFVVAHRRWTDFVDRGHGPRAWLFQIALRVASDARRHRRRHPVDPDGGIAQDRASIEPPQAREVARKEAINLLDRALASIDLGRRAVLVLHEIEQMTAPEIAKTLEIPLNTVYSRLRVARTELEQEIARLTGGER
jgi:RNA polymerase sigma-70 factor (ECF subfamily)